jgi:hypothetical protein
MGTLRVCYTPCDPNDRCCRGAVRPSSQGSGREAADSPVLVRAALGCLAGNDLAGDSTFGRLRRARSSTRQRQLVVVPTHARHRRLFASQVDTAGPAYCDEACSTRSTVVAGLDEFRGTGLEPSTQICRPNDCTRSDQLEGFAPLRTRPSSCCQEMCDRASGREDAGRRLGHQEPCGYSDS